MNLLKECILDCEFQHEGYCIGYEFGFNPDDCRAKTDDDLVTEEEYIEQNRELNKR